MPETKTDAPVLIFSSGADTLQLEKDGKVYRPGDQLPRLSQARKNALRAQGIYLTSQHAEPVLTPDRETAAMAAAEQIAPPPGGPAVVAALEDDVGAADVPALEGPKEEPSPRATRKAQ